MNIETIKLKMAIQAVLTHHQIMPGRIAADEEPLMRDLLETILPFVPTPDSTRSVAGWQTPRTDAVCEILHLTPISSDRTAVSADFARTLEREANNLQDQLAAAESKMTELVRNGLERQDALEGKVAALKEEAAVLRARAIEGDRLRKELDSARRHIEGANAINEIAAFQLTAMTAERDEAKDKEAALASNYESALAKMEDFADAIRVALGDATSGQWTSIKERFSDATIARLQAVVYGHPEKQDAAERDEIASSLAEWMKVAQRRADSLVALQQKVEEMTTEYETCDRLRMQAIERVQKLESTLAAATRQNEEMSETNKRLNRRCQKAEGIVEASGLVDGRAQGNAGRTLGRALANYAADKYRRERDIAVAQVEHLKSHFAASGRDHEVTQETLTRVLAERDRWEQMYRSARIDVDSHHAMCVRIWSSLGECDPDKMHDLPCDVQLANRLTAALAQVEQLKDRVAELEGGK